MTDQNAIPAEKVRELAAKYDGDGSGDPERLLADLLRDLHGLLPTQQPTSGLLGRWAKHEEYGDVVCMWDRPGTEGNMHVRWVDESFPVATGRYYVALSDLTFPEQATRPEDVPRGEAWLVDIHLGDVFYQNQVALKYTENGWISFTEGALRYRLEDDITLISPLTPERPGKDDLQARYDELEDKYREAQEKIAELEQSTPRTVTTEAEYAALPIGSMFVDADNYVWKKGFSGNWIHELSGTRLTDAKISGTTRTVLRYGWGDGWGDEQPAWRIEHDLDGIRAAEVIRLQKENERLTRIEWLAERAAESDSGLAYDLGQINREYEGDQA